MSPWDRESGALPKTGYEPGTACQVCGCTDEMACINEETGEPCYWVAPGICSACYEENEDA